jgi:hypothetical protein
MCLVLVGCAQSFRPVAPHRTASRGSEAELASLEVLGLHPHGELRAEVMVRLPDGAIVHTAELARQADPPCSSRGVLGSMRSATKIGDAEMLRFHFELLQAWDEVLNGPSAVDLHLGGDVRCLRTPLSQGGSTPDWEADGTFFYGVSFTGSYVLSNRALNGPMFGALLRVGAWLPGSARMWFETGSFVVARPVEGTAESPLAALLPLGLLGDIRSNSSSPFPCGSTTAADRPVAPWRQASDSA